jgi:anti-anti-sigma factor
MHTFDLRTRTVGDVTVVSVGGTAGEPLAPTVGLRGLIDQGVKKLVLDLTGVPFLASSNIGKVMLADRRAKQAGVAFRLCCPEPSLRDVFAITKLDQLLPVYPSLDAALAGL